MAEQTSSGGPVTISYTYRRGGRTFTRDGFPTLTAARMWALERDAVIQGTASNPYDRAALILASMPAGLFANLLATLQGT